MVFLKRAIFLLILGVLVTSCKDDRSMVVGKIHKASKLATTEFTVDKIVHGSKSKRWIIKFGDAQFIAFSKAIIKTGIDLEKLSKRDIQITENSITLKLPQVEVINFSYPPQHFEKSNLSKNARWNKITVEDQEVFFREAEFAIRDNLEAMGIVETTQEKTRTMLRSLLQSLGYEEVYIEFEDGLKVDKVPEDLLNQDE